MSYELLRQVIADGELRPAVCDEPPRDIHQFQLSGIQGLK